MKKKIIVLALALSLLGSPAISRAADSASEAQLRTLLIQLISLLQQQIAALNIQLAEVMRQQNISPIIQADPAPFMALQEQAQQPPAENIGAPALAQEEIAAPAPIQPTIEFSFSGDPQNAEINRDYDLSYIALIDNGEGLKCNGENLWRPYGAMRSADTLPVKFLEAGEYSFGLHCAGSQSGNAKTGSITIIAR